LRVLRNALTAFAILAATGGISMAQTGNSPPGTGGPMQSPRPGHFAELEELQAARRAGTLAAYDLFLARHPDSRYAAEARAERAKISR
jgi:hypothetical protein